MNAIGNFSHVQSTIPYDQIERYVNETKYSEKLKNYVDYYEKILNQIFM